MSVHGLVRSRWAAIGAAVAVSLGGSGLLVANAGGPTESSSVMIAPVRVLDTRDNVNVGLPGPFVSPVGQKLQITGAIPTTEGMQTVVPAGATGVALNVTVVRPGANGFLSIRPGDATGTPATSSLNNVAGVTLANAVTVALPTGGPDAGRIEITWNAYGASGPSTEVLIDVVGYTSSNSLTSLRNDLTALAADTYTKSEVDALLAPFTNSAAAFAGGEQNVDILATETIFRSVSLMPPANGIIVVNSSAHFTRSGAAAAGARCSITTGSSIDYSFLQIADLNTDAFTAVAGTRGFNVTKGVLFTANFVCDQYTGDMRLQDSSLTAIFAPS